MSRRRSSGFTLIELLVVIAIIGVLMGLLLPAVQKVRSAAARVTCMNNLKQLGLAENMSLNSYNSFSPGRVSSSGGYPKLGVPNGVDQGWAIWLLPYVEQESLYRQYRLDLNWNNAANNPVTTTQLKVLQCPATPTSNRLESGRACTDYSPLSDIYGSLVTGGLVDSIPAANRRGVLATIPTVESDPVRIIEVLDGTSNTILLIEDAGRPERWRGGAKITGTASGAAWADDGNAVFLHGHDLNSTTSPYWGPCAINCYNSNEPYSFHAPGMNVVFADGHVQFLSATIDIRTFARLLTFKGGEIVNLD